MSSIDLLRDPIGYAKKAVEIIEYQLVTAVSEYRKIKLRSKLNEWKKFVELMEKDDQQAQSSADATDAKPTE